MFHVSGFIDGHYSLPFYSTLHRFCNPLYFLWHSTKNSLYETLSYSIPLPHMEYPNS